MAFIFETPDEEDRRRLRAIYPKYDGFVRCQPFSLFMPVSFQRDCPSYYNFDIRKDDTWVISFPKSGNFILPIDNFVDIKAYYNGNNFPKV